MFRYNVGIDPTYRNIDRWDLFYITMFLSLGLFWFWMAKPSSELITLPSDVKLQCLSYAPFGKDDSPFDIAKGFRPSVQQMEADLAKLSTLTNCIRTYSSVGLEALPEIARKHGLKLWLGAWVSSDAMLTQKEIETVIDLAKEHHENVEAIVVGNEALLRRDVSAAQLVGYILSFLTTFFVKIFTHNLINIWILNFLFLAHLNTSTTKRLIVIT